MSAQQRLHGVFLNGVFVAPTPVANTTTCKPDALNRLQLRLQRWVYSWNSGAVMAETLAFRLFRFVRTGFDTQGINKRHNRNIGS